MCASSCGHTEAFFLARDAAVSQEVANGKISVQSACALKRVYLANTKRARQLEGRTWEDLALDSIILQWIFNK
jgi:hypothetical protein